MEEQEPTSTVESVFGKNPGRPDKEYNPYLDGKRDGISELANSIAQIIFLVVEIAEELRAIKRVGEGE